MKRPILFPGLAFAALALAGCNQQRPAERPVPAPLARAVGPAVSCVPLAQIRETRVRDDWTIDFISSGNRAWRNALTMRCPGLRMNDAITYSTSLNQLCSTDIVYVLETAPEPPLKMTPSLLGRGEMPSAATPMKLP